MSKPTNTPAASKPAAIRTIGHSGRSRRRPLAYAATGALITAIAATTLVVTAGGEHQSVARLGDPSASSGGNAHLSTTLSPPPTTIRGGSRTGSLKASAPSGPVLAPTQNQVNLKPGCPFGSTKATSTVSGITLRLVATSDALGPGVELCLTLPSGKQVHPVQEEANAYGLYADRFPGGSYFKTDSQGHVFALISPGNNPGVTTVIPDGERTRVLGMFVGGVVDRSLHPFGIKITSNDCTPDCAHGHLTTRLHRWNAAKRDYS